jgi:hypothetical protein
MPLVPLTEIQASEYEQCLASSAYVTVGIFMGSILGMPPG